MGSVTDSLSANLKKIRKSRDISQEKLAELVGCSKNHISAIERGIKFPSPSLIDKICSILEIKPYILFLDNFDNESVNKQKVLIEQVMESINSDLRETLKNYYILGD